MREGTRLGDVRFQFVPVQHDEYRHCSYTHYLPLTPYRTGHFKDGVFVGCLHRLLSWDSKIDALSRIDTRPSMKNIFVTGGAGFIGSHTALCLLENGTSSSSRLPRLPRLPRTGPHPATSPHPTRYPGYKLTVVDNLDNSFELAVERVVELAGDNGKNLTFVKADLRSFDEMDRLFAGQKFDAVIHFAGRKYVNESVDNPLRYYDHNVAGTVELCKAMAKNGCKTLVFSSSCTVYGNPTYVPLDEKHPLKAVSPYGRTKLIIEDIFRDLAASDPEWNIILLRYFNPVGAHPSGKIGEHQVMLNNLMPWVQAVALGHRPVLQVYGTDYPTRDGTCVRDYIHVVDLAEGHMAALKKLEKESKLGCVAYNLGTGHGTTVLEMVHAFEKASGLKVPLNLTERRPGDAEAVWAATETAERELGWKAKLDVEAMCADQWAWASANPDGPYRLRPTHRSLVRSFALRLCRSSHSRHALRSLARQATMCPRGDPDKSATGSYIAFIFVNFPASLHRARTSAGKTRRSASPSARPRLGDLTRAR